MTRSRSPRARRSSQWHSELVARADAAIVGAIDEAAPWGPMLCPRCSDVGLVGPAQLLRSLASTGRYLRGTAVEEIDVVFVAQHGDVDRVFFVCSACRLTVALPVSDLVADAQAGPGVPRFSMR